MSLLVTSFFHGKLDYELKNHVYQETDLLLFCILINLRTCAFVIENTIKNGDQHPTVKEFKNYLK